MEKGVNLSSPKPVDSATNSEVSGSVSAQSMGRKEPKILGPARPSLPSDCSVPPHPRPCRRPRQRRCRRPRRPQQPEPRQVASARQPAPRPEATAPVGEVAEQGFGEMAAPRGRNLYRRTSEYCGFHSRHHSKASFIMKREVPVLLGEALAFHLQNPQHLPSREVGRFTRLWVWGCQS